MGIHVNIGEAKARFSELCAAALRGEDVIVQKAGVPKLKLVPIDVQPMLTREEIAAKRRANFGKWGKPGFDGPSLEDIKAERGDPDERFRRKFGDLPS